MVNLYKNIILVFFLILLFPIVFAQPPGQVLGDLNIIYPKQDVFSYGDDFKLHVHAYNSLNELLNVTDYDCFIHIYDIFGNHEIEADMDDDSNWIDKEYYFNSSLHNDIGWHAYNIFCNSTQENGAVSESFLITFNGEENDNVNQSLSFLSVVIMFLGISMLSLWISTRFDDKEYKPLRMSFFWMSIINILVLVGYFALYTTCVNTGCSEYGRFNSFGEGLFLVYGLFTVYVLWNYTYIKLKKSKEDWFGR